MVQDPLMRYKIERFGLPSFRGRDRGQKCLGVCWESSRFCRATGCEYWLYWKECCLLRLLRFPIQTHGERIQPSPL